LSLIKKIVLLGDSAVGKTSLIRRYVFDKFEDSYIATIGSKVTKKELQIHSGKKVVDLTLVIWDLIGREGYHALHSRTFAGVHGALLVADLTREETLNSLEQYWIPLLFRVVEGIPLVFAFNKSDLEGEFEFELEDVVDITSKYNTGHDRILTLGLESCYSTSAKNGSNVEKAFESLGHLILSPDSLKDPVKELYENLMATGICRTSDKTTTIGALDAIIVDFCEGFEDSRIAMLILRQEIARAGIDVRSPSKEGIFKVVDYLAEAESEFKDENTMVSNVKKRLKWAKNVSG
jgi:small GTP-binding protein